ncbi:PadR family transcriptional regulator [Candidatus Frankia alpina]|uniref:Helix-turn-helix transcriptional regulator n=1 Tax=Candidatus Frankia alpina TaxID=2699483 RepID=A0A4S5ESW7_9ACTN|nr:PadR family transcriptional regulator [Candidatus Frankia alpina]THJ75541.1 helix-turn-helix transcriptional regulator [Candidatus Frankia alpina]
MTSQAIPGPWGRWGRAAWFDPAKLSEFFETMAGWVDREVGGCGTKESAARDQTSRTARGGHGGGHHDHGGPGEGRPRGRRGGPGWPPFAGFPGPGFGPGFGGPGGFGRGPRVGRGDVREALLALLAEQPMHGYQMIRELAERSGGSWRPSPGSVYPVLSLLADEGLVRAEEAEGKRVFHLTDTGRAHVESRTGQRKPWETAAASDNDELASLRSLVFAVGAAVVQVAQAGDGAQIAAARSLLTETRRSLYRILAGDEGDPTAEESGSTEETGIAGEDDGGAAPGWDAKH